MAYKLNDFVATLNGGAVVSDSSGTIPTVDKLTVPGSFYAGPTSEIVSRLLYFNKRLPDAKLIEISKPDIDFAATSYINAVIAAGTSPTSAQIININNFIIAEKTAGRWPNHKRIYFPIWANAAANAIDMRTGAIGSFPLGATHTAGWFQCNGTSQYFNLGTSFAGQGLTTTSGYLWALQYADATAGIHGIIGGGAGGASGVCDMYSDGTNLAYRWGDQSVSIAGPTSNTGILSGSTVGTTKFIRRRSSAGKVSIFDVVINPAGAATTINSYVASLNQSASTDLPTNYSIAKIGACGFGLGLSDADDTAFTLNLKTLWETCTGLTLP